jgi:hypothetical protein
MPNKGEAVGQLLFTETYKPEMTKKTSFRPFSGTRTVMIACHQDPELVGCSE